MESEESKPKMGSGHASAMWRQGLAELRAAMYAESNVAQPPQYGVYGTRTPGEVAEARRGDQQLDLDEEQEAARDEGSREGDIRPEDLIPDRD